MVTSARAVTSNSTSPRTARRNRVRSSEEIPEEISKEGPEERPEEGPEESVMRPSMHMAAVRGPSEAAPRGPSEGLVRGIVRVLSWAVSSGGMCFTRISPTRYAPVRG
ncbi:hypothetical protein GCM10009564_50900 [Streptomyces thermogriseus]|uniref:Uncharacterized protein n=1 Tax=Streptomyces thermogriseus TaxID=75292 RepID=A0ABP4DNX9_9ACTN